MIDASIIDLLDRNIVKISIFKTYCIILKIKIFFIQLCCGQVQWLFDQSENNNFIIFYFKIIMI